MAGSLYDGKNLNLAGPPRVVTPLLDSKPSAETVQV
jgi:hypothetical protein